jgi:hypothetical protein
MLRRLINRFMNLGLNRRDASFIFQNRDDARMVQFARLDKATIYMIGGSGVDLGAIPMHPHPADSTTIVGLPARLLRDKGVYEFVEAATQIRDRGHNARFILMPGLPTARLNGGPIRETLRRCWRRSTSSPSPLIARDFPRRS